MPDEARSWVNLPLVTLVGACDVVPHVRAPADPLTVATFDPTFDPTPLDAHAGAVAPVDVAGPWRARWGWRRLSRSGGVPLRVAFVVSLLVTAFVVAPLALLVRGDGPAGRPFGPAVPVVPVLGRTSAP